VNDVCVITWIKWKMDVDWVDVDVESGKWKVESGCGCGKWLVARFRISH